MSGIRRRDLLAGMAGGTMSMLMPSMAHAAQRRPTQWVRPGPFYPYPLPAELDLDLVDNNGVRAKGEWLDLRGRVLDDRGRPLSKVRMEVWQCDANGCYHHPSDPGYAPRDPGFQGYGAHVTGADGAYRLRTIKPVPYRGGRRDRTPHIHFRLSGSGFEPFTTQMFVAGEPGNERDALYNAISNQADRDSVTVSLRRIDSPEAKFAGRFDLVLHADGRMGWL